MGLGNAEGDERLGRFLSSLGPRVPFCGGLNCILSQPLAPVNVALFGTGSSQR